MGTGVHGSANPAALGVHDPDFIPIRISAPTSA
jgi:hypothetical protein